MTEPHDAPTAAGLVEAVREFLEADVLAATEGRVQFHTRVAINALRIVERELTVGADQARRYADGLSALGMASERELAAAIRAGRTGPADVGVVGGGDPEVDPRLADVARFVRATVADKLAVANPGYVDP